MTIRIALAGNPNCGKTTMFNRLTGSNQKVGNWPGVTVERKEGKLKGKDARIIDLPGIYSLSPYSPEEVVSRDFLLDDAPDAVINIVDATNIERNLYLTTQILEVGIPVVVALNMMDVIRKEGIQIDVARLSSLLGCPVIEVSALKGDGMDRLTDAALEVVSSSQTSTVCYSESLEGHIGETIAAIKGCVPERLERWTALKLLEKDSKAREGIGDDVLAKGDSIIQEIEEEEGDDSDSHVASERYLKIGEMVSSVYMDTRTEKVTTSDKIDRIITNRWLGLPIFAMIIFGVYSIAAGPWFPSDDYSGIPISIGTWGTDLFNGYLEDLTGQIDEWLVNAGIEGALHGLIVGGILAGVFAVLGFLPQMLVMFLLLAILEECGYMARVAFVMDRIFRRFGLSGKSFIPILVGTGCGVPGIMASRAIEGEKERKITVMTTTFIPCSAKLPVIAMITGALFTDSSSIIMTVCYFMGIVCILMSGIILKKWKSLTGTPSPFIMELPPYHAPAVRGVLTSTLQRGWAFVRKAGTFILLACALVWFLASFDWSLTLLDEDAMGDSILAGIGRSLQYVFIPLGWGGVDNWEFTVGTLTGLLAKENVVGTFEILFGVDEGGADVIIGERLSQLAGFSFLAFNLICAPCFAAIGAMRRELVSWKATGYAVAYQCGLAYVVALIVYNLGTLFTDDPINPGFLAMAVMVLVAMVYILVARDPFGTIGRAVKGEE